MSFNHPNGSFYSLLALRRQYKNWKTILLNYLVRRLPRRLVLRNGFSIDLSQTKIFSYFALAYLLEDGWKVLKVNDDLMTLCNDSESMTIGCRYKTADDVFGLAEVSLRKDYGSDFRGKVVLDIGMSNADAAIFFARHGAARVIGLEPLRESFLLALENIETNKLGDKITALQFALSNKVAGGALHVSRESATVSSLRPIAIRSNNSKFDMTVPVATTTILALMDRFGLSKIDVLKLDCEGCEYEVIRNLPALVLRKIMMIVMEFHDGTQDLSDILAKSGFAVECESGSVGYLRAVRPS